MVAQNSPGTEKIQRINEITSSPSFLILKFTHAYDDQLFLQKERGLLLDASGMHGTNCYCDDAAHMALERLLV